MKNYIHTILTITATLTFIACNKSEPQPLSPDAASTDCEHPVKEPGLALRYTIYDTLFFSSINWNLMYDYKMINDTMFLFPESTSLIITAKNTTDRMNNKTYANNQATIDFINSQAVFGIDTAQAEIFYNFKNTFGDTLYTGNYCSTISYCITDTIDYVNITCNKDWDSNHPSGTLLNDILTVYTHTAEPLTELLPIKYMPLNQFNNENHYLVDLEHFYLNFTTKPDKTDTYSFFMEYKTTGGKLIKAKIYYDISLLGKDQNIQ